MGKVKFVKDVLMDAGGEVADEGLRYLDNSFGALKNLLNRYYSNMARGSKLTTRGKVQDTDLGRMKVNVGRVPLEETGRTIVSPKNVVEPLPLDLEKLLEEDAVVIPTMWDRSDLGVLKRVNEEDLAFDVPLEAGYKYPTTLENFEANRYGASNKSPVTTVMNAAR